MTLRCMEFIEDREAAAARLGSGQSCLSLIIPFVISIENKEFADCRQIQKMLCLKEELPIKSIGSGTKSLIHFLKILN